MMWVRPLPRNRSHWASVMPPCSPKLRAASKGACSSPCQAVLAAASQRSRIPGAASWTSTIRRRLPVAVIPLPSSRRRPSMPASLASPWAGLRELTRVMRLPAGKYGSAW